MDIQKIDRILKFAITAAGREDDYENRELGPIHLVKYVYLADLAYSETHNGETYTGTPWKFHHFGPWCLEVFNRIQPTMDAIGAHERTFSSPKYEGDFKRWSLINDKLFEKLEDELPSEIKRLIRRSVHDFGNDTTGLLHYVYISKPMLNAAPGEDLKFEKETIREHEPETGEVEVIELSKKQEKKKKEATIKMRERVKERLAERRAQKKSAPPTEYDEDFYDCLEWVDSLAGDPIETEDGVITFSEDIWKSESRSENDA